MVNVSSTAKQLIDAMVIHKTTIQKKKNGVTVGFFRTNTDKYPTFFNIFTAQGREQFVITLPVGNHIPDSFFSVDDRTYLIDSVKAITDSTSS